MGFNSVYKSLLDIFPQVDPRLLRAVAIEHPKDADVAAEIILTEVIPSISNKLLKATPPQDKSPTVFIDLVESDEEDDRLVNNHVVDADMASSSLSLPVEIVKNKNSSELDLIVDTMSVLSNTSDIDHDTDNEVKEPNIQNAEDNLTRGISDKISQEMVNGFIHQTSEIFDQPQLDVDVAVENSFSSCTSREMESEQNHLTEEVASISNNDNGNVNPLNEEWVDFVPTTADFDATICDTSPRTENFETALIDVDGSEAPTDCNIEGHTSNTKETPQIDFNAQPSVEVVIGGNESLGEYIQTDRIGMLEETIEEVTPQIDFNAQPSVEDVIGGNESLSEYNQTDRIGMLEETIEEAKTNKKTLFSSMESLINLMREVELLEKSSEEANIEAARGGSDILDRVEEYKAMLVHAKEANDMHAGEIYGEKAVLATELKELQSRLFSLSDERDKSLAILEEMRQVLEARLAAAEILSKASELDKMAKEESARKALLEQEAMMEKVAQESKRLHQEADENSKLREFLMDRGRVVDILQGEISVICQDIRLLKEKFDANLPLSKSFTSCQTTCSLASSGSSHKTLLGSSEHSDSSEILKISPAVSNERPSSSGEQADHNALLDDGWDIFEKDAELDALLDGCTSIIAA